MDILRLAIPRLLIGTPTPRGGLPISCQTSNLKSGWRSSALAWFRSTGRLGANDQTTPLDRRVPAIGRTPAVCFAQTHDRQRKTDLSALGARRKRQFYFSGNGIDYSSKLANYWMCNTLIG
jgi:hypothetical protein